MMFSHMAMAVPKLSAVERVSIIAIRAALTEGGVVATVWGNCGLICWGIGGRGHTVVVTIIADRAVTTIHKLLPVAAIKDEIIHLVIRACEVLAL